MELLEQLIAIPGAVSDEGRIKDFIQSYVEENSKDWACQPKIISGKGFQDTLLLVFGKPTTVIFAHIDTIGFSVGYDRNLIKVGGPRLIDGIELVGEDSKGKIEAELMVIESEEGEKQIKYVCNREIDRGTLLTFKPDFRISDEYVQSPYLDNRLGVWCALEVAKTLKNGAIAFSTYEEHGGNSVGFMANYLYQHYDIHQALISDITWVTDGVKHGEGVAISMRDSGIPRRSFLNRIIAVANEHQLTYQLEVESAGGSDGTMLQKSDLPFDWCFIGAPEDNVHSPDEKVHRKDIESMVQLYRLLMDKL